MSPPVSQRSIILPQNSENSHGSFSRTSRDPSYPLYGRVSLMKSVYLLTSVVCFAIPAVLGYMYKMPVVSVVGGLMVLLNRIAHDFQKNQNVSTREITELTQRLKASDDENQILQEKLGTTEKRREKTEGHRNNVTQTVVIREDELNISKAQLEEATKNYQLATAESVRLKAENEGLTEKYKRAEETISRLNPSLEALMREKTQAEATITRLTQELAAITGTKV